jgi:glycosyltransferase involved in cell wall biosynthesis
MLTVVVPVYNEETALRQFHRTMTGVMDASGIAYELLYVNDGSTDASGALLDELGAPAVHLERNRGYGAAIKVGIARSYGEHIAIIDCDGTYDPRDIPVLFGFMDKNDMVVGRRPVSSGIRTVPKWILKAIASYAVSYAIPDLNSGIRIFKRALVMSVMKLLPNGFSFTSTITMAALYHCFLVRFVPVGYARRVGSSKIRPVKAVLGFAMLIARTMILFEPLKFFLPPSVLFGGVGLLFLVRDIIAHNLAQASILMITNGFILLAIGLLAEAIRCKD